MPEIQKSSFTDESGLWTPTLSFQSPGSFVLGTPTVDDGTWERLTKNSIRFNCRFAADVTINDANGYAIIQGLPFTSTSASAQGSALSIKSFHPLIYPASYTFVTGGYTGGGDLIFFFEGANPALRYVSASDFTSPAATAISITVSGIMEVV